METYQVSHAETALSLSFASVHRFFPVASVIVKAAHIPFLLGVLLSIILGFINVLLGFFCSGLWLD